jgi:hypothetical protein
MLDNVTQGEVQRYENNYKALNLITPTLGRNVYDVGLKLCNTYKGSSEIKSSHNDTMTEPPRGGVHRQDQLERFSVNKNTINTHKYNTIY